MPDPSVAIALVALVALLDANSVLRVPVGAVLAIGMLASGADLLPVAALGALGVVASRLALALTARVGRDRLFAPSAAARARRDAIRAQLAGSSAYARMTFLLAALPGFPANLLFPMLGAMRAPLWPALAGTLVGRVPVFALTTALFAWIARALSTSDSDAASLLAVAAVVLLAFRLVGRIDWAHRAETGRFRLREDDAAAQRITTWFAGTSTGNGTARGGRAMADDEDVIEGELLGEDFEDEDDQSGPGTLPAGPGDQP